MQRLHVQLRPKLMTTKHPSNSRSCLVSVSISRRTTRANATQLQANEGMAQSPQVAPMSNPAPETPTQISNHRERRAPISTRQPFTLPPMLLNNFQHLQHHTTLKLKILDGFLRHLDAHLELTVNTYTP